MQQEATNNPVPDAGGGGALDLLSSAFLGSGMPSIPSLKGGDAGPSNAISSAQSGAPVTFSNPFSVAGQGGTSNATATPTTSNSTSGSTNLLLVGLAAIAVLISSRK